MSNVDDSNETILRLQRELVAAKKKSLKVTVVFVIYTLMIVSWIVTSVLISSNVLFWVGIAVLELTLPPLLIMLCIARAIRYTINDDLAFEKNMLRYNQ